MKESAGGAPAPAVVIPARIDPLELFFVVGLVQTTLVGWLGLIGLQALINSPFFPRVYPFGGRE